MVVEQLTMMMIESADRSLDIDLTLVVTQECSLCAHARDVLAKLGEEFPLSVRELSLDSPEGTELAQRLPLIFPPVLLRDGAILSYGRLSEKRLRKELHNGR